MATKKNTFKYGGLDIVKINSQDELVPADAILVDFPTADKKALAIAVNQNLSALLIGETGTGKTSAIKQLAFLRQQPYVRVNMTGFTTPDELIGSKSVKDGQTYYENGIITDAMQRGAILVIDEINATTPDCLFILHGLLDEDRRITLPNGAVITPHADFRVFATANPDYEGTKSMNKAFIDRFPIIIAVDILAPKKEEALLIDRTGIDAQLAKDLITIAQMARKDYAENKISTFVSTRSLLNIGNLIRQGLEPKDAYITTLVRKTSNQEEQAILKDFFMAVMKMGNMPNPDKPVITTEREINGYQEQIEDYRNTSKKLGDDLDMATNDKIHAEEKANELETSLQETILEKRQLATRNEELEQTLKTYQKLDEMISAVAKKQENIKVDTKIATEKPTTQITT